jgi:hypothetical protein
MHRLWFHCQYTVSQLPWSQLKVAGATVKTVEPVNPADAAEIVVVPPLTLVARPPPLMVATPVADEFQVTVLVMLLVEPSLKVPVAVNCWVLVSVVAEGAAGVTAIDASVGGGSGCSPPPPPQPTSDSTSRIGATRRNGLR